MSYSERPARCAVAIAASTGGPRALSQLIPKLDANLPAAVFVAQHMPPIFTAALARRLHGMSALRVVEAEDGARVAEGVVYIAPGGQHLEIARGNGGVVIRLSTTPAVWGVRPAADIMFPSIARAYGRAAIGVVLTGMGRDGSEGMRLIRQAGGSTIVQDEASSVIPSMPRAAAAYADAVLPLGDIAAAISERAAPYARSRFR
jgi:two-component system, chemotaxis family, protein-glutamate methylesterase/glutaminase